MVYFSPIGGVLLIIHLKKKFFFFFTKSVKTLIHKIRHTLQDLMPPTYNARNQYTRLKFHTNSF